MDHPRDRVRAFLVRQMADRVPCDYQANVGIDRRLKAHFGLPADDDEGLRDALGIDFRGVGPHYTGPVLHHGRPGYRVDPLIGSVHRWVEHGSGGYWDFCDFPLGDAAAEAVAAWPLPDPDHYDYATVAAQCRRHDRFGLHLGNPGLGDLLNSTGGLMGMERVYAALAAEDPAWELLAARKGAHDLAVTERSLAVAGGRIDCVWIGEDLGSQRGPLCSLPAWRRCLRPFHQRLVDCARSHGAEVMIHSCGASSFAFDDFAAMGIAAVDTLQPDAAGMDADRIKGGWGDRLAFHGGIGTGGVVAHGSADAAAAEAERVLAAFMPGGGYAFSPAHALQDDTPVANVLALYRTAHRVGARSAA